MGGMLHQLLTALFNAGASRQDDDSPAGAFCPTAENFVLLRNCLEIRRTAAELNIGIYKAYDDIATRVLEAQSSENNRSVSYSFIQDLEMTMVMAQGAVRDIAPSADNRLLLLCIDLEQAGKLGTLKQSELSAPFRKIAREILRTMRDELECLEINSVNFKIVRDEAQIQGLFMTDFDKISQKTTSLEHHLQSITEQLCELQQQLGLTSESFYHLPQELTPV